MKKFLKELLTPEVNNKSNKLDFDIPTWFMNRRRDLKDGTTGQLVSNAWDTKLREDLERMKKIR